MFTWEIHGKTKQMTVYMEKSSENPTTNEGLHGKFMGNPTKIDVHMGNSWENHTKIEVYMVKSWENPTTNEGLHGKIMGKPSDKKRFTWEIQGKPNKNRCSHGKIMGKPNKNPHACRRVLWILLVRSCTVCFVFVLSRLSPWRGFLPRLTWTPPPPSSSSFRLDLSLRCGGLNSAHASLNTGLVLHILLSFPWLFPFFVFAIDHRFAPSLLISNTWSTGFCAEHLLHA